MQRRAKSEVAAAPTAKELYPTRGRVRGPGDEWKGLAANILCIAIGAVFVLIAQSYLGQLGQKPEGWLMSNVTLRYFDLRGRAEAVRLFLEDIGQPYREIKMTRDEWIQIKNDTSLFAFNQLPQIEDNGIPIVQSQAIMRYIGRAYNLLGDTDYDRSMADVIAGGVEDLRQKYGKLVYDPEFTQDKLKQYADNVIPVALQQFEDLLGRLGKSYFVSGHATFVDYLVWDVVDVHRRMSPLCLRPYPLLGKWFHTMEARPRLHAYLRSDRRPKYVNGNIANYDNQKVGPAVDETKKKTSKAATKASAQAGEESKDEF